jgi:hypothetical protein
MAREPLLDVPGGKPVDERLGEMPLDAFQETAAVRHGAVADRPAAPGARTVQHRVDVPVEP